VLPRSEGVGEFGEDRCEPMPWIDIHAELVVAASEVRDDTVNLFGCLAIYAWVWRVG
jgi:hypothetical protein